MRLSRLATPWGRGLTFLAVLGFLGIVGSYFLLRTRPVIAGSGGAVNSEKEISVAVASPIPGGIDRLCRQPGSVEPFLSVDLYTKVSGYLIEQKVDIGYKVRAGDVLFRIWVPEYEKQVKEDASDVVRTLARADQMKAAIATAEADLGAATAAVALAEAEKKSKVAYRAYREKQRDRIQDLVSRMAIDAKLADEQEDQYQAAVSADLAATEAVNAARQKEVAARTRVEGAKADLRYAEAAVDTAKARRERSQVLVDYATIRSPFTGVITKRNFQVGDFIRSADAGGDRVPVLVVERTDVMRVVIQVPERDVPFVDCGDPAIIEVDALGIAYKTEGANKVEVSLLADSEDPRTRMMRTEVHVKNNDGKLRRGMFGRATLVLQRGAPGAMRIPATALSGKADGEKGFVRIVKDNKANLVPVRYGSDNGSEIEILSGLAATDRVIVQASGPIDDGTFVKITDAKPAQAKH